MREADFSQAEDGSRCHETQQEGDAPSLCTEYAAHRIVENAADAGDSAVQEQERRRACAN